MATIRISALIRTIYREISSGMQHLEDDMEMLMTQDKPPRDNGKDEKGLIELPTVRAAGPEKESGPAPCETPHDTADEKPAGTESPAPEEKKAVDTAPEPAAPEKETDKTDKPGETDKTDKPVTETAAGTPPEGEKPAQEKPAEGEKPAEEKPAETPPEGEKPAEEKTAAESPVEEVPAKPWNQSSREIWPKSVILARAKQAEKNVQEWIATYGRKFDQFEFAFNFKAGDNRVHAVYDPADIPEELWFIGDLHGDILALDSALSYIDSHSITPTIVFLGDLFDRFGYGFEVVMRVVSLIRERPGRILWIAGNHDDGLFFKDGKFLSKVIPAEFVDFLNSDSKYEEFGKWLIDFCQLLPRALFLPDGLFVAHGGCLSFSMDSFCHVIDSIKTMEELEKTEHLRTFIWNRIIPDQSDKSEDEVGKNDLIHFFRAMEKLTGFPVKRMLRGHDHCRESRHQFFDFYYPEAPVLTLTTMSAWYLGTEDARPELARGMRKAPVTTPAIAKYRYDALPEVITLDIPRSVIEQFHRIEELPTASKP